MEHPQDGYTDRRGQQTGAGMTKGISRMHHLNISSTIHTLGSLTRGVRKEGGHVCTVTFALTATSKSMAGMAGTTMFLTYKAPHTQIHIHASSIHDMLWYMMCRTPHSSTTPNNSFTHLYSGPRCDTGLRR